MGNRMRSLKMTTASNNNRRRFLQSFGTAVASAFGLVALHKVAKAATGSGVFGGQFLEEGRVIDMPAGHYDVEQKVFVHTETGEPMVAQSQTGVMTCSYERRCSNMFYPNNGAPQCVSYDTSQVRHPDGFRPGDAGGC